MALAINNTSPKCEIKGSLVCLFNHPALCVIILWAFNQ